MYIIGFTNSFYTLWKASEPYKVFLSGTKYITKQDINYIKNLSTDLEVAKSKVGSDFTIDLTLRGSTSFTRQIGSNVESIVEEGCFEFGKYATKPIADCTDFEYLAWYFGQTKDKAAEKVLLDNGYEFINNEFMIGDKLAAAKLDASLETGLFFNDGEKVEIEIKQTDSFSFTGSYGTTWVVTYITRDGKKLKYMGASPKTLKDGFNKIQAVIKHSEYRGESETRLTRIKILK